jgi:hypothetical protein
MDMEAQQKGSHRKIDFHLEGSTCQVRRPQGNGAVRREAARGRAPPPRRPALTCLSQAVLACAGSASSRRLMRLRRAADLPRSSSGCLRGQRQPDRAAGELQVIAC